MLRSVSQHCLWVSLTHHPSRLLGCTAAVLGTFTLEPTSDGSLMNSKSRGEYFDAQSFLVVDPFDFTSLVDSSGSIGMETHQEYVHLLNPTSIS